MPGMERAGVVLAAAAGFPSPEDAVGVGRVTNPPAPPPAWGRARAGMMDARMRIRGCIFNISSTSFLD